MKRYKPKRRRDKDNPYRIYETEQGKLLLAFQDGQGNKQELEMDKDLFEAFDSFELEDKSQMNRTERHLERMVLSEQELAERVFQKPDSIEEIILKRLQTEQLHKAIAGLPEIQRRRLVLYYYYELTYEEIAGLEGCTKMPIKRSIDSALEHIRNFFEKN